MSEKIAGDEGGGNAQSLVSTNGRLNIVPYFWNPITLAYEVSLTGGTGTGTEVRVTNTVAVTGTFWQATQPVSAASLPLPTGAATETGHLAAIDTATARIPAQGQALTSASLPVVLPAAQITTLTPPAAITGFALDATVAKDATLTTIDADIKATQPRDVTDRAARLLGVITAANLDVAVSTLATAAKQDTIITNQNITIADGGGFVPNEVPEFVGAP